MHLIDWLIMLLPIAVAAGIALYARRFVRSVADFMVGGRKAGRYLLCTARSEMGAGAVSFVTGFEMFARGGFSYNWWMQLSLVASLLLAISGWVGYRYRQTRAMTMAQFFEIRYSRNFRLFTGVLAVVAGLVNFGIIPVIGARFMVYFMGFPEEVLLFGCQVPTYLVLMAIFLGVCTFMTTSGGQITVLVADCAEGMFSQVFYVIVTIALLLSFNWSATSAMLMDRPPGQSIINPFDSLSVKDFGIWYVLMGIWLNIYGTMSWQNSHGFNAAAISPHESRMGSILGRWRGFAGTCMSTLMALCAMTYLAQPEGAQSVQTVLDTIPNAHTAAQMRVPIALSQILPIGIKGLVVSVIMMGIFSGDGIHLHSWSSILIQDVVMPLRKKPLTTRQHLVLLRLGVVAVALWAFFFGWFFKQTEYVAMWFQITGAIYIGGAGAAIIGGLYWSRGTAAGAWTGLITGSTLSVSGIIVRQIYPEFPLNGMQISFLTTFVAAGVYILVSLLTCRTPHNMDQLLHRGAYAVEAEATREVAGPQPRRQRKGMAIFMRLVGIDENFSRGDRFVTMGIFCWTLFWLLVFVVGSVAYMIRPWPAQVWANYWLVTAICLPLLIGIVTTIWFTIGCWHDMREFFRRLRAEAAETADAADDGSVRREKPAAEEAPEEVGAAR